eukprot:ANDGO_06643.mRNA.1 phopshatase
MTVISLELPSDSGLTEFAQRISELLPSGAYCPLENVMLPLLDIEAESTLEFRLQRLAEGHEPVICTVLHHFEIHRGHLCAVLHAAGIGSLAKLFASQFPLGKPCSRVRDYHALVYLGTVCTDSSGNDDHAGLDLGKLALQVQFPESHFLCSNLVIHDLGVSKTLRSLKHSFHLVYRDGPFRLYVGQRESAMSADTFRFHDIKYVVNCAVASVPNHFENRSDMGVKYIGLNVDDTSPDDRVADPTSQWPAVMEFAEQARQEKTGLLIHCWAGMNRSVSTAAVFMVLSGYAPGVISAIRTIASHRPVSSPMPKYVRWAAEYVSSVRKEAPEEALREVAALYFQAPETNFIRAFSYRAWDVVFFMLNHCSPEERKQLLHLRSRMSGNSALHAAVHFDSVRSVGQLLQLGADRNIKDNMGRTPLDLAIELDRQDIVVLLNMIDDCALGTPTTALGSAVIYP